MRNSDEQPWGKSASGITGGTITLGATATDPDIVVFAYGWMDPANIPTPDSKTCGYTQTLSDSGGFAKGGFIAATNGVANLTVPANLASNKASLYVKSFNASHNMSSLDQHRSVRQFMVAPVISGRLGARIEMEDKTPTQPIGQSVPTYKEGPNTTFWAGAYQRHLVATGEGQKFTFNFDAGTEGYYALSAHFSKINHYGILAFEIDGATVYDINTGDPLLFDGYTAPPVKFGTIDITGSQLGRHLTQGQHTLTLTVVGKNPSSVNCNDSLAGTCLSSGGTPDNGYGAGIDFIRLTPINPVTP